jgi:hypothetical protein
MANPARGSGEDTDAHRPPGAAVLRLAVRERAGYPGRTAGP